MLLCLIIRAIPTRWVRFVSCSQDWQRYPAFQPFSASRSQKQESHDDKTLLSPPAAIRGTTLSLPRRQRPRCPRGRIFAVLFAPLVDDSTRSGCTPAGELKMSLLYFVQYEAMPVPRDFFERLAGRGLARRHGRGSQLHHEALQCLQCLRCSRLGRRWPQSSRRLTGCGLAGREGPGAASVARSR
jgi:hypothetical protein